METTDTAPVRHPNHLPRVLLLVALLALFAFLVMRAAGTPGTTTVGKGFISQVVSDAPSKASVTVPLTLRESDPEHESSHIFGTVANLKGVASARLVFAPPALEVAFDPATVSEQQIRDALAAGGYVGEGAAQQ